MTNFIIYSEQPFKKFIGLCCFLFLFAFGEVWAQPAELGHASRTGSYENVALSDRGTVRALRYQATGNYTNVQWGFCLSGGNFTTNWRPFTSGQSISTFNTRIDPASALASARYNTGSGGQQGQVTVSSGRYYTWIVGKNATANNFMSVLETTYNPRDITAVSTVSNVYAGQTASVSVTLSGSLQSGERLFIRYSTDSFSTSSFVEITSLDVSNVGTAIIPAQLSGTVQYYALTSNVTPTHADADYQSLNFRNSTGQNVSGTNFSYSIQAWASVNNGNWSNPNTWNANAIPPTGVDITIANNVNLNQDASVRNITINASQTLTSQASNARVLTVSGVFTNNGTSGASFISNDGKVTFTTGSSIVGNDIGFNNVDVGALNMNFSGQNVIGVLTMNAGSSISNAPIYGSSSTLAYNVVSYVASNEWITNSTSGAGVPNNVVINAGAVSFGTAAFFRYLSGVLTINSGTTLTLSGSSGGDLRIEGNFTNNGTFSANGRAVFFVGSGADQTITGVTTFPFMIIDKVNSNVVLNDNISVSSTITLTNGGLDLNGKTLTFSGNSIVFNGTTAKSITSTTASIFDINTNATAITRSAGTNTIAFGSNITLRTNRGVNFGSGLTDINGIFQIESGGFANTNTPNYQSGSTLRYNSGTVYARNVEWSTSTPSNVELANNTTLDLGANSGTATARVVTNTLTVGSGSTFSMNQTGNKMTATLTVGNLVNSGTFLMSDVTTNNNNLVCQGNITNNGTLTTNNQNISIQGNWINNGTFNAGIDPNPLDANTFARVSFNNAAALQTIGGTSTTNFYDLTVNKTAGKVRLLVNIGVTFLVNMLAPANVALLDLNGNNIDCGLTGNVVESPLLTASYVTDESASDESNRGGAITFSGRTINTGNTAIGGINLARTTGSDYTVSVTRRHYRGAGIGLKRIFEVNVTSGTATGTNTTVVFGYSDGDLSGLTESTLLQGKWSSGIGWVTYPAGAGLLQSNLDVTNNLITVLGYNSFSSVTGTSSNNAPLPVSLVKFEGQSINKTQARLTWQTATEINNKQFEVEKSIDGASFEKITTIDGNGNSNIIRNYQTIDNNFITSAYYRLRQVDFNGAENLSQVIFIKNNNDKILIYPNPTSGEIFIQSNENKQNNVNWKLIDAQGKIILNGNDAIENVEKILSNQLKNQNKGMFIIEIQGNKEIYRQKLIVE